MKTTKTTQILNIQYYPCIYGTTVLVSIHSIMVAISLICVVGCGFILRGVVKKTTDVLRSGKG